jgi:hypothetical protein
MEGSGSAQIMTDPDLGGPKTYRSYGSGTGSGPKALVCTSLIMSGMFVIVIAYFSPIAIRITQFYRKCPPLLNLSNISQTSILHLLNLWFFTVYRNISVHRETDEIAASDCSLCLVFVGRTHSKGRKPLLSLPFIDAF